MLWGAKNTSDLHRSHENNEDTIKVKTHSIHYSQGRRKDEIVREEVPPCNCSLIEMVIADSCYAKLVTKLLRSFDENESSVP